MMRRLVPLLMLVLVCSALPAVAVETGALAPDFSLQTLDGRTVRLSEFKGKPILLKLATTWCPTCRQQSQEILAVADDLKQYQVEVVEVFIQDSPQMVEDYLKELPYPISHVALLDDGSVYKAYSVFVIPRTILIDRDFKVRRDGNLMPASELKAALAALPTGN
ncbi:hypothetical protein JCM30471_23250 [Desulfuromonas carbonis]|uniref:peroxiredoxin family protein n=1 Tax=Desulfuromonas sp. DDH964 TaxID=1823759 RepID=UPI00078BBD74|nr:TlpA disulfide reductase family protein [Desulfuromonas sp. DDH964]AMV73905.1 apocytochrome c disulfide reductase lipoprotein ResA [Desulfuromonas sp. DDH964]